MNCKRLRPTPICLQKSIDHFRSRRFLPAVLPLLFVAVHQAYGIVGRLLLVIKLVVISIEPACVGLGVGLPTFLPHLATLPYHAPPCSSGLPSERFLRAFLGYFPFHASLQDQLQG